VTSFAAFHYQGFPSMTANIIDGKRLADDMIGKIRAQIERRVAAGWRQPGLAVIHVGEDPASVIYVRNKKLACERAGIRSTAFERPGDIREADLLALIDTLNENAEVDGILVQLPLPAHIDPGRVIERIRPDKDVDGFHPCNIGRLIVKMPTMRPCTPKGIMTLLNSTGIPLRGSNAVVVGASNIVGRPMTLEFMLAGCTTTICNSATHDLPNFVRQAEILVVAIGKPELVKGEWIREGSTVVDVGINRRSNGSLCGDVEFEAARNRAAWITPVPGGVGPMTVACLMENTLLAAKANQP
jgi:methylenetetrahydrofolate dehydrogenase (NADP+) / methenyltetrahydrofolate cyclohydrolase